VPSDTPSRNGAATCGGWEAIIILGHYAGGFSQIIYLEDSGLAPRNSSGLSGGQGGELAASIEPGNNCRSGIVSKVGGASLEFATGTDITCPWNAKVRNRVRLVEIARSKLGGTGGKSALILSERRQGRKSRAGRDGLAGRCA